jgi:cell division protein FtsN
MPVQTAAASPAGGAGSVSAAWAARGVQASPAASAPGAPALAAPASSFAAAAPQRNWTLAPTETQHADAVEPGLPEAPVRLAAAEMPAPRRPRFRLVRPAMAEPAPLLREAGRSGGARNWSVQVGAFGTQAQANQAAGAAQSRAPSLSGARAEIAGIRQGRGGRVYRARLTGLSRGDALQACQRLARGRGDCMVVSPDARS